MIYILDDPSSFCVEPIIYGGQEEKQGGYLESLRNGQRRDGVAYITVITVDITKSTYI